LQNPLAWLPYRHKEQPGYIVNSLLVPLLSAATDLLVNEAWMPKRSTKPGWLPLERQQAFGILDIVSITTAYNINKMSAEATNDPLKIKTVAYLKEHFIDKNKLGVATGEGFYTYPNPAYQSPDFLK
jgi:3-hydroxybutyryl-CoA dehydrogenase